LSLTVLRRSLAVNLAVKDPRGGWPDLGEEREVVLSRAIVTSEADDERRSPGRETSRAARARPGNQDSDHGTWLRDARSHLRGADPVLARLIDERPAFDPRAWMARLPAMDLFGALIFQVTGQQLSVPSTRRILARIQDLFGGRLPSPAQLLQLDPDKLREAGLSRRKVSTLRDLAERFEDGRPDPDVLSTLSDDEILAELTVIPGIGPWTVQGALLIALQREDVVLPGDLALRKAVQTAYQLDHLPTQQELLDIADKWRPYRSLATSYLFSAAFEPAGPAQVTPTEG
jgi:DNA-3-methyladenine glycosylase II